MAKAQHPWEENWNVGERIGKGGQGVTHKVSFREDVTIVGALKYLKNNKDHQARGRTRREVTNLEVLGNQGASVPRVLDNNTGSFGDAGIELYVVMDFIPGPTLGDFIEEKGPVDIDCAVAIARCLCKTVKIAHKNDILHRDLKPDNVILRNGVTDDVVIVDFGLSFNKVDEDLTQTDETFRNRFLDLPETNTPSGDRRDSRSDVTALCAILYFCLTGKAVGQLPDATGALPHLRPGHSVRDAVKNDARLGQVEALLGKGLSINADNRFQNVDELEAVLVALTESSKEVDECDPFQVAAMLSEAVRRKDRRTQLAEFQGIAINRVKPMIDGEVDKYTGKLVQFEFAVEGGNWNEGRSLGEGLDSVWMYWGRFRLKLPHHSFACFRQFSVASRGEQCVLLALDYDAEDQRAARKAKEHQDLAVKVIGWYRGNPEEIGQSLALSVREWVTASVRELAAKIGSAVL